ncbi:hypothetical protein AAVH_05712 [Aphelenchoides avenae]|nr:hypothetical protein AAVH_05712 [Aphelenchus avenae]
MRASLVRLAEKFIKHRDFTFENPKHQRNLMLKTAPVTIASFAAWYYWIWNFAWFTPDMLYDVRMATSPDFYEYATADHKFGEHNQYLNNVVKAFDYKNKKEKRDEVASTAADNNAYVFRQT